MYFLCAWVHTLPVYLAQLIKSNLKGLWWKILGVVLLVYVHLGGLLLEAPRMDILNETVRALYFHVPMWFGMSLLFLGSLIYSILYLLGSKRHTVSQSIDIPPATWNPNQKNDFYSVEFAHVGVAFGILGMLTGMLWANYTWGTPWHGDPKQKGAAIALLVYFAYFVLRGSFKNEEQRARLSAVYNIFAFVAMTCFIFILPRLEDSMHPGNGGNPGFNAYDLDSRMRTIFYPAVIGWFIIGIWITSLRVRYRMAQEKILEAEL